MKLIRFVFHLLIILFLTITTQIGGVIYFFSFILFRKSRIKRYSVFVILYLLVTFLVVPQLAPYFGRNKIKETNIIKTQSFFYKLCNRNYVKNDINTVLNKTAITFSKKYPNIKIVFLDANFPFWDGFPLLPHLSHNDGKKLDLSLIYSENGKITNKKPSISGYGVYESPKPSENNQTKKCIDVGYWQYDFSKYLSFGNINSSIQFSEKATKDLIQLLVQNDKTSKLFIEPHLKERMGLKSTKIRFHGCRAIRHDDHIHIQVK